MLKREHVHLSIFEGFGKAEMDLIEPLLEENSFPGNTVIFEQGRIAIYLYILLEGEVRIRFKPYDGPELIVARILPGDVFGWSAALGRCTYTSGAITVTESSAVHIRGDQLRMLCERHPDIGVVVLERLAGVIAERLRSTHAQILTILMEGLELTEEFRRRLINNGK